jgi:WD40 repeat protein
VWFSPDGKSVLTLADGKEALLWSVRTGAHGTLLLKHGHDVRHAVISPDGKRVATASWDRTARIWDARTGLPLTKPLKQSGYVNFICFSPDSQRVATVSDRSEAGIWDAATGELLVKADKRCTKLWLYNLQFSPDGRRVAMATFGGGWIWDADSGAVICQLQPPGDVYLCRFSPDGQRVVTASNRGSCRIVDATTGRVLVELVPNDGKINWAEFSPDGNRVVTASRNKIARILDAHTGQMLTKPLIHADLLGHYHSVQFSPDGRRVVTAAGKAVQVWDAQNGEPLSPRMEHRGRVTSVRFSSDGKRLIAAVFGDDSRVWDAATGHPVSEPLRHRDGCHYAEFSPDGEFVVTASADGTAGIWWVPIPPLPAPAWLPELAEALAGRKMDETGNSEVVPVENLFQLKQRLSQSSGDNDYGGWVKWFFTGDPTRPLSPSWRKSP